MQGPVVKKSLFLFVCFITLFFISEKLGAQHYFFDGDGVRYQLYQTNGEKNYNWLFFPGGPGGDSCYLGSLIDELQLPGNVWLIDFPGNGSNTNSSYTDNFDGWFELFPKVVKQFKNPIVVGHSFGGMLPLLYPELETTLKGIVVLNSTPALSHEEAEAYAKQFDLPDLIDGMQGFIQNPNQDTFNAALNACMPYYFPKETLEKGSKFLSQVPFAYLPAVWGQVRAAEGKLSAKWVSQQLPIMIIGAKYDCMCPFSLFKNDQRFQQPNIKLVYIENGGHCPWIENPIAVRQAFEQFNASLVNSIDP